MTRLLPALVFGLAALLPKAGAHEEAWSFAAAQEKLQPDRTIPYKTLGDRTLSLHLFHPDGFRPSDRRPAYIVIHGGGWRSGTPRRFYPYAQSLVPDGFVGISVEYRLVGKDEGVSVADCVRDVRAAVRSVRANAESLGIDPARIAVGGGSAGGHLALGTALFDSLDHPDEDLTVSCRPDALVLLFAVLDTSPQGYGNKLIGPDWKALSPRHQLRPGLPPVLLFHGDQDQVASEEILTTFCASLRRNGIPYQLVLEKGGVHGHINNSETLFKDAARRTAAFFTEHLGKAGAN